MSKKILTICNISAKIFLITLVFNGLVAVVANPTPAHKEKSLGIQKLILEPINADNPTESIKQRQQKVQSIQSTEEGAYISKVEFAGTIAKVVLWFGLMMASIAWVRRELPKLKDSQVGWMAARVYAFGAIFAGFTVQVFNNIWIGETPFALVQKVGILTFLISNLISLSLIYLASGLMAKIIIRRQNKRSI